MVINSEIPKLQKNLESISKRVKELKRKKGELTRQWVDGLKNCLIGASSLFGEDFVRNLGKPSKEENFLRDIYRRDYFEDIKYRSKLRKIRDEISSSNIEYSLTLLDLRHYLSD